LGKTTLFYCKSKPILAAFELIAFAENLFIFPLVPSFFRIIGMC